MSKLDEMSIGVRVDKTNAHNSSLLGSIERPNAKHLTDEKIKQIIDAIIRDEGLDQEDRQLIWMGLMAAKDYYEGKK